ncbi:MAG: hypothetical protein ACRDJ3_10770 [Solirubrobacteraceae bacterium]
MVGDVRCRLLTTTLLLCVMTCAATAVTALGAKARNPSHNRPPSRATLVACLSSRGSPHACDAHALADIGRARRGEGLTPMVLPGDYKSLSVPERLLAVTDLERVDRGLPPVLGLTRALDDAAREGAIREDDPFGPGAYAWASNWAGGSRSPLFDDFVWMYDDGVGSGNISCRHRGDADCWGHRDNILLALGAPSAMGAAIHGSSITELFIGGYRPIESGGSDPLLTPNWTEIAHTRPTR